LESLRTHIACYESYRATVDYETDKSEEFARNTAFFLFDFLIFSSAFDDYFSILKNLMTEKKIVLDVITGPLNLSLSRISQANMIFADAQKVRGKLNDLRSDVDLTAWRDSTCKASIEKAIMTAVTIISQRYPRKKH
jgi:hypothetical protein